MSGSSPKKVFNARNVEELGDSTQEFDELSSLVNAAAFSKTKSMKLTWSSMQLRHAARPSGKARQHDDSILVQNL